MPGRGSVLDGRQAAGVARFIPAEATSASAMLVVASPSRTSRGVSPSIGARLAADAASHCLAEAIADFKTNGATSTIGECLDRACSSLSTRWAQEVSRHRASKRDDVSGDGNALAVEYDNAVAAAALIEGSVVAFGFGDCEILVLSGEGDVLAARRSPTATNGAARSGGSRLGQGHGWHVVIPVDHAGPLQLVMIAVSADARPRTLALSLPGTGHVRDDGKVCQDAAIAEVRDGLVLLAVADGHGDARYTHADLGARFAVQAVRDAVSRQVGAIKAELSGEATSGIETAAERLGRRLAQAVFASWYARVRAYLALESGEDSGGSDEGYDSRVQTFGTTLLVVLAWQDVMLCLRLGDGDVLVVDEAGATRVFDLPDKEFGNATSSLAAPPTEQRSTHETMEVKVLNKAPRFVFVCSDGVSDAYFPLELESANEGKESVLAHKLGTLSLKRITQVGWEAWTSELPGMLAHLSSKATFDDASVAVAWWPEPETASSLEDWAARQAPLLQNDWKNWILQVSGSFAEWLFAAGRAQEASLALAAFSEKSS